MTIPAGEFKARCLKLMDVVNETHENITITKRGKAVARLVPVSESKDRGLFGFLGGCIAEEHDIVSPAGESWAAEKGDL